jgi:ADP-ribosylglycohydrolase
MLCSRPRPQVGLLLDRYTGCLVGGAIGDALGLPVETQAPDRVRLTYPSGLTDFQPWHGWTSGPKGTFTDDTQLSIVVAEWLIASGIAEPEGADLAERICTWLPKGRGMGAATRAAAQRLINGEPWWQAGTPSAGNGAAMRVAPIGLRFAGQANDMRHVAMVASIPTHKDWTAVASAVVHAAAVGLCLTTTAEALEPEVFLQLLGESVSDLQLPAQSQLVLPTRPPAGASNKPALAQDANSHGGRGASRRTPAAHARPRASNASANTDSRGTSGPASGSRRYSSRVNNTRTCSARTPNRRNHPRTVDAGRPSAAAIDRWPCPAALASNAAPITDAASARRSSHTAGNSTCVLAQLVQVARRGRCRTAPTSRREDRQRA